MSGHRRRDAWSCASCQVRRPTSTRCGPADGQVVGQRGRAHRAGRSRCRTSPPTRAPSTRRPLEGWPQLGPVDRGAAAGRRRASRVPSRWRGPPERAERLPDRRAGHAGQLRRAGRPRPAGRPGPRGPAAAQPLRGPGPDRPRPARPRDPAALRRRARACRAPAAWPHGPRGRPRGSRRPSTTSTPRSRTSGARSSRSAPWTRPRDLQSEIERIVDRAAATLKFRPPLRIEGPVRHVGRRPRSRPTCWRCSGEALSNASRHADASAVDVRVSVGDRDRASR